MSNYGPPGPGEPPDPWADRTVAYPQGSVPQSVPPAPQSVPPAPQYQPGTAAPNYPSVPQNPQYQQPYGQPAPAAYEPTSYQPNYQQPAGYDQGYGQPGYDQGYQPGYQAPAPKKSSAVLILSIVLGIVVVGAIVAGVLLYQRNNSSGGTAAPPPAAVGECVVSNGKAAPNVGLNKAVCAPGSYKIVKIIPGTSDQTQCATVTGSNYFFAYKWSADTSKSYVLCMTSQ